MTSGIDKTKAAGPVLPVGINAQTKQHLTNSLAARANAKSTDDRTVRDLKILLDMPEGLDVPGSSVDSLEDLDLLLSGTSDDYQPTGPFVDMKAELEHKPTNERTLQASDLGSDEFLKLGDQRIASPKKLELASQQLRSQASDHPYLGESMQRLNKATEEYKEATLLHRAGTLDGKSVLAAHDYAVMIGEGASAELLGTLDYAREVEKLRQNRS